MASMKTWKKVVLFIIGLTPLWGSFLLLLYGNESLNEKRIIIGLYGIGTLLIIGTCYVFIKHKISAKAVLQSNVMKILGLIILLTAILRSCEYLGTNGISP